MIINLENWMNFRKNNHSNTVKLCLTTVSTVALDQYWYHDNQHKEIIVSYILYYSGTIAISIAGVIKDLVSLQLLTIVSEKEWCSIDIWK